MAITTLDGVIAAPKQKLVWLKTGTRTLVAAVEFTVFDIAGNPGAGTLNVGNTANGLVHDDTYAGYPPIGSFGGKEGYIAKVDWRSSVACHLQLFDRLFAAGAYAYNADVTLASQPSYSGRVPGGVYSGLELWIEAVTAFTGTPSVQINYLDQDGGAGDTGVVAQAAALTVGRCGKMPLASGDSGIQQITRVRGTVASAGTFNVMVLRPLWEGRVAIANAGDTHDLLATGFPLIFDTSALYMLLAADSTAVGLPHARITVAVEP